MKRPVRFRDFPRFMLRRWYLFLPVFVIWGFAFLRLFVDPTPRIPLLFNWTPSLPYRVALMRPVGKELHKSDLIVFAFAGEAKRLYPGLNGQPFFKIVRGVPGDTVSVEGRKVFINDESVGIAKTHTFDRRPLTTIREQVIPDDHYYVQGTGPDSFDSRYRESGLVDIHQVLGVVIPIF
ncbi:MAG: conjugative transfer signal peptidase TraF [Betaproteobacteria bacterium]|nr:conjugative transfer signal peptidase TraF [Betaproteobacteria bacterium]